MNLKRFSHKHKDGNTMPEITYITLAGEVVKAHVPLGMTLMRGAIEAGIDFVPAGGGGRAPCRSSTILVDATDPTRLPPASTIEGSMLEDDPAGYRLSCQILVDPAMDGLIVRVATSEY